jgi:biopolymer transport protein ExbB
VLAFNWLVRRNKSIMEDLAAFTNDLHGYLMSDGKVKPVMGARGGTDTGTATGATTTAGTPGSRNQPLRTGSTQSGAQTSPTADRV